MTVAWSQLVVDADDPVAQGRWWQQALGWPNFDASDDGEEVEVARGTGPGPTLLFVKVPDAKSVKNRLHIDLTPDDQAAEVDRLRALGATPADVGQGDDVTWVVLADPEGNEFCVLRARPAE